MFFFFLATHNPLEVYLDRNHVRVDYENGRKLSKPLDDYFLYVGTKTTQSGSSKHTYFICLMDRKGAELHVNDSNVATSISYEPRAQIPIRGRILSVDDLKSVLAQIQDQLSTPLNVIYASDEISEAVEAAGTS